jgi:SpoVK/Ycf46/Vps4 family AAA+-type ATPase
MIEIVGSTLDLDDLQEHLARVDFFLMALEDELNPPADRAPCVRDDLPPPPEEDPASRGALTTLIRRFNLSPGEADLFRMAVAVELSPPIAATFAQLQGDRRFRRPQIGFALRLLEPDPTRRLAWLPLLREQCILRRHMLIELLPPWRDRQPLFTELEIAVSPVMLHHLVGVRTIDPQWMDYMTLVRPRARLPELVLPEETRSLLENLIALGGKWAPASYSQLGPPEAGNLLLYFYGIYGTGRRSAAEALAAAWGLEILQIDLEVVPEESLLNPAFWAAAMRDSRRLGAMLMLLNFEKVFPKLTGGETQSAVNVLRLKWFFDVLTELPGPVVVSAERPPSFNQRLNRRLMISFAFTSPADREARLALWARTVAVQPEGVEMEPAAVARIAGQFAFSPGQMRDAVKAAVSRARARELEHPRLTEADLRDGCIAQLRHDLESLSRKTRNMYTWDDLILPEEIKKQLRMLEVFIRNRDQVYETWGLGRKLVAARGVKALFFGASGTGKTMAATVIAQQLNMEMFKVDLSNVVSKWVGETEKNLDRVFTEAQKSHAVILFDEADSLFGKRGKVEKGTDRYSNMEINYLLQRFEEYDGVVVLTSNFAQGIDEAFSRRMHFNIEFPKPDEEMRMSLWKSMIPPELPLADDVDLAWLVKHFELSGGNIQNVVLGASFQAADSKEPVRMLDFVRAVQWEYQKIGRSVSRGEFGEYFDRLT